MLTNTKKRIVIVIAMGILLTEMLWIGIHRQEVVEFLRHYGWIAPVFLFKSFIKKFLLLNFFGIMKVLWGLFGHLLKLLIIKLLKTFGIRYGTYFSTRRWQKFSQRLRLITKGMARRKRGMQMFMMSFRKREYALIIFAFFPVFLVLFLFGIAFRITREAMVKKGSELGVTTVAYSTAHQSEGFIAKMKRFDKWILRQIERLTK